MKNRNDNEGDRSKGEMDSSRAVSMKKKKKKKKKKKTKNKRNMGRLGGTGLSLEAFANAKSTHGHYNPAIIKKQREFYRNAKYVSKFKKKLKQESADHVPSSAERPSKEDVNEESGDMKIERRHKGKKTFSLGLKELYERKHEEAEKARMEREAVILARKEEREKVEARRKAEREKMLKKTKRGQPLMKFRIEHLLQTIDGSQRS